jgi:hypothetical protein
MDRIKNFKYSLPSVILGTPLGLPSLGNGRSSYRCNWRRCFHFAAKKNENDANSYILEFALNTKLRREFGDPGKIRKLKPGGRAHI